MAQLRNVSTGTILSCEVEFAATPWKRTFGLLMTARIEPECGLWFESCRAIHTIGMRSQIDVVFLGHDGRVVAVKAAVPPNRPIVSSKGTHAILEMGPGFLERHEVAVGQRLELSAST